MIYSVDLTGFSCLLSWSPRAAVTARERPATQLQAEDRMRSPCPLQPATLASPLQGAHCCSALQVPSEHPFSALSPQPCQCGERITWHRIPLRDPHDACKTLHNRNSSSVPGGSSGGEAGSFPQMCLPQVCPVTPNATRARSLPLGDCPTAQFSRQPGGFQKYIVHVHEQRRTKPTPAHRLSAGLSGLLHTTSSRGYQRGMTLPVAGPHFCKHGPKNPISILFFSSSEQRPRALPQEN